MTSGVIVQARMGSTRLPGKVLMPLAGRSVLAWVLERCRAIPGIDGVCCAIPEGVADDDVALEARCCGVPVFRGTQHDVLYRYYRAAKAFGFDTVMRITSDCPLIDPWLCGEVLALQADPNVDYACNNLPPSWPHGLDCEAMSFAWLARAVREAEAPDDREHVTPFIRRHPAARRRNRSKPGPSAHHHRWTLDTRRDLWFLQEVAVRLPAGPAGWDYRVPLAIVEAEPAIAAINTVPEPPTESLQTLEGGH
jgi:spore coat polysaccharide biosynthesis protein SpsF